MAADLVFVSRGWGHHTAFPRIWNEVLHAIDPYLWIEDPTLLYWRVRCGTSEFVAYVAGVKLFRRSRGWIRPGFVSWWLRVALEREDNGHVSRRLDLRVEGLGLVRTHQFVLRSGGVVWRRIGETTRFRPRLGVRLRIGRWWVGGPSPVRNGGDCDNPSRPQGQQGPDDG